MLIINSNKAKAVIKNHRFSEGYIGILYLAVTEWPQSKLTVFILCFLTLVKINNCLACKKKSILVIRSEWTELEILGLQLLSLWDDFIKLQFISHCSIVIHHCKPKGSVIFSVSVTSILVYTFGALYILLCNLMQSNQTCMSFKMLYVHKKELNL